MSDKVEYIHKQKTIDSIISCICPPLTYEVAEIAAHRAVENMPKIEVSITAGRWTRLFPFNVIKCDKCGCSVDLPYNYCPHCGDKKSLVILNEYTEFNKGDALEKPLPLVYGGYNAHDDTDEYACPNCGMYYNNWDFYHHRVDPKWFVCKKCGQHLYRKEKS